MMITTEGIEGDGQGKQRIVNGVFQVKYTIIPEMFVV